MIHNTNKTSWLAYLEYWIHNGIEANKNRNFNADFLFKIFNAIKYDISKRIRADWILRSFQAISFLNNPLW